MEEKKVIKIKLSTIIAIVLVILIIFGTISFIAFSKKQEISMSNSEIKNIATDYQYEIQDEQLKEIYNKLLGEETLIVSKESAKTIENAERISIEYKNKMNTGLANDYTIETYESYTDFEYIDFIETDYYYKYIGEYTYKYRRTSTNIEDHSQKYAFLIFKSDYFDYPYLKKYNDEYSIKEFGDILAVLNFGRNKLIKSTVKENAQKFTYNLYYISISYSGPEPDSSGIAAAVITATNYSLEKATLTVDKTTGKINLDINQGSYLGYMDYKNSYYPCMNTVTIKSFSKK